MTRELKLALIVGFLLVLLVSVLIADHLSGARKAELASTVTPNPAIAPVIAPAPQEPLVTIEQGKSGGIKFADGTTNTTAGTVTTPGGQVVAGDVMSAIGARTGEPVPPPMTNTRVVGPVMVSQVPTPDQVLGEDTLRGNQQPSPDKTTVAEAIKSANQGEVKPFGTGTVQLAGNGVTVLPEPAPLVTEPKSEPKAAEDQWYTIVQGDSAFKIAKKFYGKGEYWKQLQAYNGDRIGKDGNVRVGVRVKIPEAGKLGIKDAPVVKADAKATDKIAKSEPKASQKSRTEARTESKPEAKPATSGGRVYTVKKGDTLGQIAQRELGTMKRVDEIVKLNKLKDAGSIREGMKLNLPAQ